MERFDIDVGYHDPGDYSSDEEFPTEQSEAYEYEKRLNRHRKQRGWKGELTWEPVEKDEH